MKALAFIERMRVNKTIPDLGTAKEREPDARLAPKPDGEAEDNKPAESEPQEKTHDVVSAPAFSNTRLSDEEESQVYLELAEFLNDKAFCILAQKCLEYVQDKESVRVRMVTSISLMQSCKTEEAEESLFELFTNIDTENVEAMKMYGHCKFIRNQCEEAL